MHQHAEEPKLVMKWMHGVRAAAMALVGRIRSPRARQVTDDEQARILAAQRYALASFRGTRMFRDDEAE